MSDESKRLDQSTYCRAVDVATAAYATLARSVALALLSVLISASSELAAAPGPETVAPIAEKLFPAVVNISSTQLARGPSGIPLPKVPKGSPFEDLLEDFFNRRGNSPLDRKVSSLGSGFVIDGKEGLIVTNNHVIDSADEIWVTFPDGKKLKVVEIVGRDQKTDLALLKVNSRKPLPSVAFGPSTHLKVGDWVMAIGNPFGLGGSLTLGIISAKQRDINAGPYDEFLQTDAAINKGNSGGPLFDMNGKVIGVNTAIISPSGGSIGIGFATPSDIVIEIISQLRQFGSAQRGWLGVKIQTITDDIAESLGVPENMGALVAGVTEASPAEKSGLKTGDVILGFAGQKVSTMRGLPRLVAKAKIGQPVDLEILRQGKKKTLSIVVGRLDEGDDTIGLPEKPAKTNNASPKTLLGMALTPLTSDLRTKMGLSQEVKGLVVTSVEATSVAAEKNIQVGDVISEVQQDAISTPDAAVAVVDRIKKSGAKSVLILVENPKGDTRFVALPLD
ncbi:MAG: Do family serine endopeptidase [Alphaproteobacteria bacterium]|nr:Do family serine endopeptidase [Alphaproteobacteria bacterium]